MDGLLRDSCSGWLVSAAAGNTPLGSDRFKSVLEALNDIHEHSDRRTLVGDNMNHSSAIVINECWGFLCSRAPKRIQHSPTDSASTLNPYGLPSNGSHIISKQACNDSTY